MRADFKVLFFELSGDTQIAFDSIVVIIILKYYDAWALHFYTSD